MINARQRRDSNIFIESERLYLRDIRRSDVNEKYCQWMNDSEVTGYLESRFYPNSVEKLHDYVNGMLGDCDNVFLAIILNKGDRHIGNIKLGPINWFHLSAELGIIIGEKDLWGKGYATEAIKRIVDYAFAELKLHKLTAGCYAPNQGSLKAFQKVGFAIEGVRKQQFYYQGRYVNGILLGMLNPEGDNTKEADFRAEDSSSCE
ncbi:MAG: GNAT family N-acetyltransferase [Oscillatoria sp. SIO1A7]|nr:GNAT family N-acetyltransferase [Oscillatoria sp. SIO1A7]